MVLSLIIGTRVDKIDRKSRNSLDPLTLALAQQVENRQTLQVSSNLRTHTAPTIKSALQNFLVVEFLLK